MADLVGAHVTNADESRLAGGGTLGTHDAVPRPPCRSITGKHDGNSMNMKRMRGRNHRSGGGGGGEAVVAVAAAAECAITPAEHPAQRNHVLTVTARTFGSAAQRNNCLRSISN